MCRHSTPLYKIVKNDAYHWASTPVDSPSQMKNTVFDLWLVESMDAKPGHVYIYF